jgi:hypothetical protein
VIPDDIRLSPTRRQPASTIGASSRGRSDVGGWTWGGQAVLRSVVCGVVSGIWMVWVYAM